MSCANIKFILLFVFLTFYIENISSTDSLSCKTLSVCLCKLANGHIFDISKLRDERVLIAKNQQYTLYFHPCRNDRVLNASISPSSECSKPPGVSLCLHIDHKKDKAETLSLGTIDEMTMNVATMSDSNLVLIYSHQQNVTTYITSIFVTFCKDQCKPNLTLDLPAPTNDHRIGYTLHLSIPKPVEEKKGLSTGSVLVIMFFLLCGLYFLGGALVLRFLRGARGWEMLPNHTFWCELPALVREGIAFTCNRCQTDSYNRI